MTLPPHPLPGQASSAPEQDRVPTTCASPSSGEQPRVRLRTRTGLKRLDLARPSSFLFAPEDARQDRIQAQMRCFVSLSDQEGCDNAIELLGDRADPDALFRISRGLSPSQWRISIVPDRWLFSGRGLLRQSGECHRLQLDLTLDFNPQRYFAHQSASNVDAVRSLLPEVALRVHPDLALQARRHALDANDNVLVGSDRLAGSSFEQRGANWRETVNDFLGKIKTLISSHLARTTRGHVTAEWRSINTLEIMWELSHQDALSWVSDFRTAVFAAAPAAIWRRGKVPLESGRTGNADWMLVPLTKEIKLRIYAKTLNRVRFEVCYTDAGRIRQESKRRQRDIPRGDLTAILAAMPGAAAERLHGFWRGVMAYSALPSPATTDALDFLDRLDQAVPRDRRRQLMSLLANGRGITPDAVLFPESICIAMERAGLVTKAERIRNRASPRYYLAPTFSAMFDRLLRADGPATGAGS